jgi:hypothetical protein
MFWIGLISGIILWQFLSLVFCFLWQEDEDKYVLATTGLVGGLALLIIKICQRFNSWLGHKKYKGALLDPDGQPCYCDSRDVNFYKDSGYTFNDALRSKYKVEDGWREKDCSFGVPNLRYTPIKILKAENAYKLKRRRINK